MAKTTKIVCGRFHDNLTSGDLAITDEPFKSNFDVAVKLVHLNFKAASVSVTNVLKNTTYTESDDYTIDYTNGYVTVVSTGIMANNTAYLINYTYNESSLALKINQVTNAASNVYAVCTNQNGIAVIVYD